MADLVQAVHGTYRVSSEVMNKGGVGSIHLTDDKRWVFKRYHKIKSAPTIANVQRLVEIGREVLLRAGVEPGQTPETSVNWPVDMAVENGSVTGVVLPAIPRSFYNDEFRKPQGLEFLVFARSKPPAAMYRVALLLRMAEILRFVNFKGLVHGDVNGKNLVWTVSPEPAMYLIDCDGMVPQVPPPAYGVQAPDWTDPRIIDGVVKAPDHYSDWYSLGLAMYRGLLLLPGWLKSKAQDGTWVAPGNIPESLDTRIADLLHRALDRPLEEQRRPRPDEWVNALIEVYLPAGNKFDAAALAILDSIAKPRMDKFTKLPPITPSQPPPSPSDRLQRLLALKLPPTPAPKPAPPVTPASPPPARTPAPAPIPAPAPARPPAPAPQPLGWPVIPAPQSWQPPPPPPAQLPPLLGTWQVEISTGYAVAIQIMQFVWLPNGQFAYNAFFPANPMVQDSGTWRVVGIQLILQGTRTTMGLGPFPLQQPFIVTITFRSWNQMSLLGTNNLGEQVVFRRQA